MTDKLFNLIKKITPTKWHGVLDDEGVKRYFANTGWMFGGQMFSLVVSFFVGVWVARYLGPANYGALSYSIAFVGLFEFISSLGVNGILNRELVKTPEKRDELMGTAFNLKLIGGAIAIFLSILSACIFLKDPLIKILVIFFSFSFMLQTINVISTYFNAEVKSKNNVKAMIISTIISSILKITVILLGKGIIWFIVIYVLDSLWQGIGFVKAYNNLGFKIKNWIFNNKLAKLMLNDSWPIMLASAASFIYLKIDQIMIGSMLGYYKVGIYAVAVRLVEVWYFIPIIICSSLFPAIVNAKKVGESIYRSRLKNFYILMTVIPIVMAIPITILANPIIHNIFGNGYLESVNILRIYIWSSIGVFLSYAVGQYLVLENLTKIILYLNLFTMFLNIILNYIFIPKFGLIGSAWATFFSYFMVPLGVWFILRLKKFSIKSVTNNI